uniref:Uncharacterized protein n=1 Tax=Chelydra serpentina TaxID=8475 RepID=A0A8C3SRR3_CHESE
SGTIQSRARRPPAPLLLLVGPGSGLHFSSPPILCSTARRPAAPRQEQQPQQRWQTLERGAHRGTPRRGQLTSPGEPSRPLGQASGDPWVQVVFYPKQSETSSEAEKPVSSETSQRGRGAKANPPTQPTASSQRSCSLTVLPSYKCAKHLLLLSNPQGSQSGHSCAPREKKRRGGPQQPAGARKGETTHPTARPSELGSLANKLARPARSRSHRQS